MNWAERLSTELLHTPKRDRVNLIRRRCTESLGTMVCSYCGQVTERAGRPLEDFQGDLLNHILVCEKRPELKFLEVALAAAEALDAFKGDDAVGYGKAMAHLEFRLDALKVPTVATEESK